MRKRWNPEHAYIREKITRKSTTQQGDPEKLGAEMPEMSSVFVADIYDRPRR